MVLSLNTGEQEWNRLENQTLGLVLSSPLCPEPDQQSSSVFTKISKKTKLNQTFPPLHISKPQGYVGKGTKGKGQGQGFHTLAKTLTLDKGKGFGGSGSGSA